MASEETLHYCEICDLSLPEAESYEQHVKSKNHLTKRLEKSCSIPSDTNVPTASGKVSEEDKKATEDSDDSEESSELSEQNISCDLCHKTFSSYVPYTQHLKSAQHFKQLKKQKTISKLNKPTINKKLLKEAEDEEPFPESLIPKKFISCSICNKDFSGPESYYQHLKSRKHCFKVKEQELLKKVMGETNVTDLEHDTRESETSRQVLEKFKEKMTDNILEKMKETAIEEENIFFCDECSKSFTGVVPYMQHVTSKSHEKKVKQLKMEKNFNESMASDGGTDSEAVSSMSITDACPKRVRFIGDVICCDLCHMSFSGPESAHAHNKSRGHMRKLMNMEMQRSMKKDVINDSIKRKSVEENVSEPEDVFSARFEHELSKSADSEVDDNRNQNENEEFPLNDEKHEHKSTVKTILDAVKDTYKRE